jgi:hypothetical protein
VKEEVSASGEDEEQEEEEGEEGRGSFFFFADKGALLKYFNFKVGKALPR